MSVSPARCSNNPLFWSGRLIQVFSGLHAPMREMLHLSVLLSSDFEQLLCCGWWGPQHKSPWQLLPDVAKITFLWCGKMNKNKKKKTEKITLEPHIWKRKPFLFCVVQCRMKGMNQRDFLIKVRAWGNALHFIAQLVSRPKAPISIYEHICKEYKASPWAEHLAQPSGIWASFGVAVPLPPLLLIAFPGFWFFCGTGIHPRKDNIETTVYKAACRRRGEWEN